MDGAGREMAQGGSVSRGACREHLQEENSWGWPPDLWAALMGAVSCVRQAFCGQSVVRKTSPTRSPRKRYN